MLVSTSIHGSSNLHTFMIWIEDQLGTLASKVSKIEYDGETDSAMLYVTDDATLTEVETIQSTIDAYSPSYTPIPKYASSQPMAPIVKEVSTDDAAFVRIFQWSTGDEVDHTFAGVTVNLRNTEPTECSTRAFNVTEKRIVATSNTTHTLLFDQSPNTTYEIHARKAPTVKVLGINTLQNIYRTS